MANQKLKQELQALFVETGKAHHQAFLADDGNDPDWPIWYADFIQKRIGAILGVPMTRSQLTYCLMFVDFERQAAAPDAEWTEYYADHLIECFAPATTPEEDRLALYYFPSCPFCVRVRRVIEALAIEVELLDIHSDSKYRDKLIEVRGRSTVPVLRIQSADGQVRFMPESSDIIRYLEQTYTPSGLNPRDDADYEFAGA